MGTRVSNSVEAVKQLEGVLKVYHKADAENKALFFLMLCKAFEVAVESIWKDLKRIAEKDGIEVNSPGGSFRAATQIGIIDDGEFWLKVLALRNASVHDYFNVTEEKYIQFAEELVKSFAKFRPKIKKGLE